MCSVCSSRYLSLMIIFRAFIDCVYNEIKLEAIFVRFPSSFFCIYASFCSYIWKWIDNRDSHNQHIFQIVFIIAESFQFEAMIMNSICICSYFWCSIISIAVIIIAIVNLTDSCCKLRSFCKSFSFIWQIISLLNFFVELIL